ncbi:hypothetical protein LTR93_011693 [Exophiala xenobiotica]|nr:hypothetical protein LTR93_011693 [Exophiala xenobiotica]
MASARHFALTVNTVGNFDTELKKEPAATEKAEKLLQENLDKIDMMFMDVRHNHIAHQVLAMYALGASPDQMQYAYDRICIYMEPLKPTNQTVLEALKDKATFKDYLDDPAQYSNYLAYFQGEVDNKGVKAALEEHLFANDEHASRILIRWFASIMHPVLHLGYALEYGQPALVAEALAQAAIHERRNKELTLFLPAAEKAAAQSSKAGSKTLLQLMQEIHKDSKLHEAYLGPEPERIKNVINNAFDEIVEYTSQYHITAEQLEPRLLEMLDVIAALLTVKAGQLKEYKANFFFLHALNSLVLWPSLVHHPWLSFKNSIRLLEWQGRYFLLLYAAEALPKLSTEDLADYKKSLQSWNQLFQKSILHKTDDGHLPKAMRALAFGEQVWKTLSDRSNRLMEQDMWLKLANLILEHVPEAEESEIRWEYGPVLQ